MNTNFDTFFEVVFQSEQLATGKGLLVLQTHTNVTDDMAKDTLMKVGKNSYGKGNLGLHVNDIAQDVFINRNHLLVQINQYLQCLIHNTAKDKTDNHQIDGQIHSIHWLNQVHSNRVQVLDLQTSLAMQAISADAITTCQRQVALAIMTADCVPIVLYQEPNSSHQNGQIAVIHAGWQGLANGVIVNTVQQFLNPYQTPIKAWIGACISQNHYEVGLDMVEKLFTGVQSQPIFAKNIENLDTFSQGFYRKNPQNLEKVYLDLPKLTQWQLATLGVQVMNGENIPCSYASHHYYSYRRQTHLQQPNTGRMAMLAVNL